MSQSPSASIQMEDNSPPKPVQNTLDHNWHNFVNICRKRCQAHIYTAWYWNVLHTFLNIVIVILAGVATLLAVIEQHMPGFVIPLIAGIATLLASVNSFLKPAEKYQRHHDSANTFNILMFKLIRCKSLQEYEVIVNEIYDTRNKEPFLLKKEMKKACTAHNVTWVMTPKLFDAIKDQKQDVQWKGAAHLPCVSKEFKEAFDDSDNETEATEQPTISTTST